MKIAIQGHSTRGNEVIQILESLGGKNSNSFTGESNLWYFIDLDGCIISDHKYALIRAEFKTYTLEEFEKEFPFIVGDKVKHITSICTIIKYCYINNKPAYEVKSMELGVIAHIPVEMLEPYKKNENRN